MIKCKNPVLKEIFGAMHSVYNITGRREDLVSVLQSNTGSVRDGAEKLLRELCGGRYPHFQAHIIIAWQQLEREVAFTIKKHALVSAEAIADAIYNIAANAPYNTPVSFSDGSQPTVKVAAAHHPGGVTPHPFTWQDDATVPAISEDTLKKVWELVTEADNKEACEFSLTISSRNIRKIRDLIKPHCKGDDND